MATGARAGNLAVPALSMSWIRSAQLPPLHLHPEHRTADMLNPFLLDP